MRVQGWPQLSCPAPPGAACGNAQHCGACSSGAALMRSCRPMPAPPASRMQPAGSAAGAAGAAAGILQPQPAPACTAITAAAGACTALARPPCLPARRACPPAVPARQPGMPARAAWLPCPHRRPRGGGRRAGVRQAGTKRPRACRPAGPDLPAMRPQQPPPPPPPLRCGRKAGILPRACAPRSLRRLPLNSSGQKRRRAPGAAGL